MVLITVIPSVCSDTPSLRESILETTFLLRKRVACGAAFTENDTAADQGHVGNDVSICDETVWADMAVLIADNDRAVSGLLVLGVPCALLCAISSGGEDCGSGARGYGAVVWPGGVGKQRNRTVFISTSMDVVAILERGSITTDRRRHGSN